MVYIPNVIEAHWNIVHITNRSWAWRCRINQSSFACMHLTKAYEAETSCNQLIDWFCSRLFAYILYSSQTTNQHSPWLVSKPTSLSASPPLPTPSKRAAASTRGAPRTSQWSTLCPLSQWSAAPPVGAVWSTPSSTWRGAGATSSLLRHSLETKEETQLSWKILSC